VVSDTTRLALRLRCDDLAGAIDGYVTDHGFRLDTISPADAPRVAVLELVVDAPMPLRLELTLLAGPGAGNSDSATADDTPHLAHPGIEITTATSGHWGVGRAEMQYRDLVPSRLDGRLIGSQIRIPTAGPVPDQVHFHEVGFQLIYCLAGWVRLVYQDQGEPFLLEAGDAILQAPTQRHRVLESSAGLEVLEVSSPAEHPTRFDHDLDLPNTPTPLGGSFGGQPYVHHQAGDAAWRPLEPSAITALSATTAATSPGSARSEAAGPASEPAFMGRGFVDHWAMASTGIAAELGHQATVTVVAAERTRAATAPRLALTPADTCFLFVLEGSGELTSTTADRDRSVLQLHRHDAITTSAGISLELTSATSDPLKLVWISFDQLTGSA